jgi:hypothetical protein
MNKYILFYGNLYECPAGIRRKSCPLYNLGHLSFEEKYKWFSSLTEKEKDTLVDYHDSCINQTKFGEFRFFQYAR